MQINSSWTQQIQSCSRRQCRPGPGPEGRTTQLKAEIYKLVLYEEGTFLLHQDSEKAHEIFGITNTPVQSSALLD
jgi:hypothetical protein